MRTVVAVAGGIGAGKSVVSRILRAMGYPVYDSDSHARSLMDSSDSIKRFLKDKIHQEAVDHSGRIDRTIVASVVFSDESKLSLLNSTVHTAVRVDFCDWVRRQSEAGHELMFVECAILCSSGLVDEVDYVWVLRAPEDMRVARVCSRSGLTPRQALSRIESQRAEQQALDAISCDVILNDGVHALLPQVEYLLQRL